MLIISIHTADMIAVQYNAGAAIAYHTLTNDSTIDKIKYRANGILGKNFYRKKSNNAKIARIVPTVKICVALYVISAFPVKS